MLDHALRHSDLKPHNRSKSDILHQLQFSVETVHM